ncbi:MAG: hypothetical protein WAM91_14435 [Candidatus Acidiferrales bacterium]
MALRDWVDVEGIRRLVSHTFLTAVGILCISGLTWMARYLLGTGWLAKVIEDMDSVVIVGALLFVSFEMLYYFGEGLIKVIRGRNFIFA